MADETKLQEAEREAKFYREAALDVPSGAHIGKAIETAVIAERMRLAANDGDDAFYDGGVCSVCLASRSDGVHREDCPVVLLRAALRQAGEDISTLTRAGEAVWAAREADIEEIIAWLRSREAYGEAWRQWADAKRAEGYVLNVNAANMDKDSRTVLDLVADYIQKKWGGRRG